MSLRPNFAQWIQHQIGDSFPSKIIFYRIWLKIIIFLLFDFANKFPSSSHPCHIFMAYQQLTFSPWGTCSFIQQTGVSFFLFSATLNKFSSTCIPYPQCCSLIVVQIPSKHWSMLQCLQSFQCFLLAHTLHSAKTGVLLVLAGDGTGRAQCPAPERALTGGSSISVAQPGPVAPDICWCPSAPGCRARSCPLSKNGLCLQRISV